MSKLWRGHNLSSEVFQSYLVMRNHCIKELERIINTGKQYFAKGVMWYQQRKGFARGENIEKRIRKIRSNQTRFNSQLWMEKEKITIQQAWRYTWGEWQCICRPICGWEHHYHFDLVHISRSWFFMQLKLRKMNGVPFCCALTTTYFLH